MAVAVVRLGRRRILTQQLAAVEMLARVDVVCLDKTGTLTDGAVAFDSMEPLGVDADAPAALAALAIADASPDASIQAVAAALPAPDGWRADAAVPFSSERRWSGATFAGHGTWVLGAPDALLAGVGSQDATRTRIARLVGEGHRVLLLARATPPRPTRPSWSALNRRRWSSSASGSGSTPQRRWHTSPARASP